MILTGRAIQWLVEAPELRRGIKIEPFDPVLLNTVSYDVTLGSQFKVYQSAVTVGQKGTVAGEEWFPKESSFASDCLQSKSPNPTYEMNLEYGQDVLLRPGIGYLAHTIEIIGSDYFVGILDGKSSIGRQFIQIHSTAGFIDPGYYGQITLEIMVAHPVCLTVGQRIGQVRFMRPDDYDLGIGMELYKGHYAKDNMGAVASKVHEQVAEHFKK